MASIGKMTLSLVYLAFLGDQLPYALNICDSRLWLQVCSLIFIRLFSYSVQHTAREIINSEVLKYTRYTQQS